VADASEAQIHLMRQDAADLPLPRLIVLDLHLPGRSGMELLGWIRGLKALRPMVVVALTGSREPGDVRLAYDIGISAFLVKPAGLDALVDMVKMISEKWIAQEEHPMPGGNGPHPMEQHEEQV
jgi:DNA-binding response OmpR family regulator